MCHELSVLWAKSRHTKTVMRQSQDETWSYETRAKARHECVETEPRQRHVDMCLETRHVSQDTAMYIVYFVSYWYVRTLFHCTAFRFCRLKLYYDATITFWISQLITDSFRFSFPFSAFPYSVLTLLVGWQEGHPACEKLDVGLSVVTVDWSFTCLIVPVVTTTSITLSSNKIQNEYILVPANLGLPGKWPLKWRELITDSTVLINRLIFFLVCSSPNNQYNSNRWVWMKCSGFRIDSSWDYPFNAFTLCFQRFFFGTLWNATWPGVLLCQVWAPLRRWQLRGSATCDVFHSPSWPTSASWATTTLPTTPRTSKTHRTRSPQPRKVPTTTKSWVPAFTRRTTFGFFYTDW